MATLNNIKISLRTDDLSNWIELNPVLNAGELAIVTGENGNQMFKIGDGSTSFKDLSYMNENEVKTKEVIADEVTAKAISQGLRASAVPLGFAAGAFISANANFSQALGYDAQVSAGHDYAFVWSGDDARDLLDFYTSKGKGTFNINPKGGFDGLFIGDTSFNDILNSISAPSGEKILILSADVKYLSSALSATFGSVEKNASDITKISSDISDLAHVYFDDQIADVKGYNDLSVLKMTSKQYEKVLETSSIVSNAIYILSSENENMFGQRVTNVGAPEEPGDATTKDYVDSNFLDVSAARSMSSDITSQIPTKVSQLTNDAGYTTNTGTLTEIKMNGVSKGTTGSVNLGTVVTGAQINGSTKTVTNGVVDLGSGYLTAHQSLSGYYQKSETSSNAEISAKLNDFQLKGDYLLSGNLAFGYDSGSKLLTLKAFGSDVIGSVDCTPFIKDGMLQNVALTGNTMVFTFNTDAGKTPVSVDLSAFVDNYDEKINFLSTTLSNDIANLRDNYFTSSEVTEQISDLAHVYIKNEDDYGQFDDLSVLKVKLAEYAKVLTSDPGPLSNALYIVSCDSADVFGQRITNVKAPELSGDAATKAYVDNVSSMIPTRVGQLQNDVGYLSAHQSLTAYALTSQIPTKTSQLANDSGYLTSHQSLTSYYQKSETSSKVEIQDSLASLQPKGDYLLSSNLTFTYDSTTKYIYLKAFGNNQIGSVNCADFIKDGMLSSVHLCGNVLVMTFNTDAGKQPISVDLSSFVDNYDGKITWLSSSISADVKNLADNYYTRLSVDNITSSLAHVYVRNETGYGQYDDLSVLKVTEAEYQEIISSGKAFLSNSLYIISSDDMNVFGQRILNVGDPEAESDAANVKYVNDCISAIPLSDYTTKAYATSISNSITSLIPTKASQLQNDVPYLSAHQSLSNYYTKADITKISNDLTAEVSTWIPTKNSQLANDSGFLVKNDISDYAKVWVKDADGNQGYNDLSVLNVTNDEFQQMVIEGTAVSNAIYIVSCATTDQYGQRIINLGSPVDLSDATTKQYVDSLVQEIPLSDYATKSEAQMISAQMTSDYALRSEASTISSLLTSDYTTKMTVSSISSQITANYLLTSSASTLSSQVTAMIPTKNSQLENDESFAKVFFNQDDTMLPDDLSVNKVSHDDYVARVLEDDILSNEMFVISSDDFDAWGSQISNVSMSEEGEAYLGIAATKPYVDELSAKVDPFLESFATSVIANDPVLSVFTTSQPTIDTAIALSAICYIFQKLLH